MALVVELRDARNGLLIRRTLDGAPVRVGRSLAAELCVDDPYLDGVHAEIAAAPQGYRLTDLSAVNRVQKAGAAPAAVYPLAAGDEFTLGRTRLIVRDSEAPLAPARKLRNVGLWSKSGWPEAAFALAVVGAFGLNSWLGTHSATGGTEVLGVAVAFAVLSLLWAGGWAVATRVVTHRFRFPAHLAVVCLGALVLLGYNVAADWATYFVPFDRTYDLDALRVVVAGAVIAAHLKVASRLRPWARRRAAAGVALLLALVIFASKLLGDEMFAAAPHFEGSLKPIPAALVPKHPLDTFDAFAAEVKARADKAEEGEER
jgi:hypothetical protein